MQLSNPSFPNMHFCVKLKKKKQGHLITVLWQPYVEV